MNHERFIAEVMRRAGFQQPAMASLAIDSTLEVLGQRLSLAAANDLQAVLPSGVGGSMLRGPHGGNFDRDAFYRRVSQREGVRLGFAVEHAQVVCQVVAEAIDADTRARLVHQLPAEIAELLSPREEPPPPSPRERHITSGGTLATGRPGSRRPIGPTRK